MNLKFPALQGCEEEVKEEEEEEEEMNEGEENSEKERRKKNYSKVYRTKFLSKQKHKVMGLLVAK